MGMMTTEVDPAMKAGEIDYNREPDADVTSGHCLLCISTPKSDLTLEA